jgi:hypothetical protein
MRRYFMPALAAIIIPSAVFAQGTVYTRAWCKDPVHGRGGTNGAGAYPWISGIFIGSTSDECSAFVAQHRQQYGHEAGCSYVTPAGKIN